MAKFRIQPHGRLQEWVAHELGYFEDEGLDYELIFGNVSQQSEKPKEVRHGALRGHEGRTRLRRQLGLSLDGQRGHHGTTRPHVGTRVFGDAFGHLRAAGVRHPQAPVPRQRRNRRGVSLRERLSHRCRRWSRSSTLHERSSCRSPAGRWTAWHRCWNVEVPVGNVHRRAHVRGGAAGFSEDRRHHVHDRLPARAGHRRRRLEEVLPGAATRATRQRRRAGALPALSPEGAAGTLPRAGGGQRPGSRRAHGPVEPYTREVYEKTHRWIASRNLFSTEIRPSTNPTCQR